jgi:hypothetical protein
MPAKMKSTGVDIQSAENNIELARPKTAGPAGKVRFQPGTRILQWSLQ